MAAFDGSTRRGLRRVRPTEARRAWRPPPEFFINIIILG